MSFWVEKCILFPTLLCRVCAKTASEYTDDEGVRGRQVCVDRCRRGVRRRRACAKTASVGEDSEYVPDRCVKVCTKTASEYTDDECVRGQRTCTRTTSMCRTGACMCVRGRRVCTQMARDWEERCVQVCAKRTGVAGVCKGWRGASITWRKIRRVSVCEAGAYAKRTCVCVRVCEEDRRASICKESTKRANTRSEGEYYVEESGERVCEEGEGESTKNGCVCEEGVVRRKSKRVYVWWMKQKCRKSSRWITIV